MIWLDPQLERAAEAAPVTTTLAYRFDPRPPSLLVRMLRALWRLAVRAGSNSPRLIHDERVRDFVGDCSTLLCGLAVWLVAGLVSCFI